MRREPRRGGDRRFRGIVDERADTASEREQGREGDEDDVEDFRDILWEASVART